MAVVVDASALGAVMFGEPDGATMAAHLRGQTLLAPALLDLEIASLALKKARRRPEHLTKVLLSLRTALALPIARVTVPGVPVFALARRTGLTAYDASYLWLARARDAELVTLDKALARLANEAEGVI
jgi:predicted nucleic acid-binding protein